MSISEDYCTGSARKVYTEPLVLFFLIDFYGKIVVGEILVFEKIAKEPIFFLLGGMKK